MAKLKKKMTTAQKVSKRKAKRERQKKYMTAFVNGKRVRIKRPTLIEGLPIDEFIEQNGDPILFHENEMWESINDRPAISKDMTQHDSKKKD
jgi:hypothetical protein